MAGERGSWNWEHAELEQQILALPRAATHPGFAELDIGRCCQILINRANQPYTMGRFVDAIDGWDKSLQIIPNFAMALANRGFDLKHYAGLLEDDRERAILLLHANEGFAAALAPDAIYEGEDQTDLRRQFRGTR